MVDKNDPRNIPTVQIERGQASEWAKDSTLASLNKSSDFTNEILLEYTRKALTEDEFKKLIESENNSLKGYLRDVADSVNDANDDADNRTTAATERNRAAIFSLKDSLLGSLGSLGRSLDSADPGSLFGGISSELNYASRQFENVNSSLAKTVIGLKVLFEVVDVSYQRISKLNEGYVSAYSSGVKFADGLNGLNSMVGESGMTMNEFIGIMNKSSQSFNVLGSRRVAEVSKEFRSLTNNGSTLTMTLAQSQEGLMAYSDILRLSGRLQRTSNRDIAAGAASYLESINELSYASGRAREELMASTKNALSRPEFQAFMATLSDGAKANLEKSITSLAAFGDEMQGKMSSFIEAGMAGGTAAMFKNNEALFMLAQQTGQLPQMMKIIEMAAAGQDVSQAMMEFTAGVENSTLVSSGQMARLAQFDPMFASMSQEFGKLMIETNNLEAAQEQLAIEAEAAGLSVEDYKKRQEEQSEGFLKANSEMQIAMTKVNSAFNDLILKIVYPVLIPGMEALAWAVTGVVDAMTYISDAISGFLSPILGEGLGEGLGAAGGAATGLTIAGAGAGLAYGGYRGLKWAGGKAFGAMGNMLPDMLKGPKLPSIPNLGAAGDAIGGIGRGVGGLGRGVGDSVAGVMGGIAKGFAAFGDPKVLLGIAGLAGVAGGLWITTEALQNFSTISWEDLGKGAAVLVALAGAALAVGFAPPVAAAVTAGGIALGAAIGAIGLGFAAAGIGIDIMGDGLASIATGLTMFGDIDGNNLVQVGLGASALGAGLAILGGGEVVKAIGSFASWIGSFFQEDPIDRLKRFGELGEPLGKAGPALDAFGTAFLNATAKMNAATLNDSVETSMDQIMRILRMDESGVFGGEPPIIGQINSLADAIGRVNEESTEFMNIGGGAGTAVTAPGMLSPSDLQKRTLAFYDNQRSSNASIIELLRAANDKLDTINTSVVDDTNKTIRALKASGNNVN
jgi:hypothetical protein